MRSNLDPTENSLDPDIARLQARPEAENLRTPRRANQPELELNLATLWRIVLHWRWLILGAIGAGLVGAVIVTFLTTPIYKSVASLEVNPPTVEVMEESRAAPAMQNDRAFLATQFGLLESRSLAERVAQDLNLASNDSFVPQDIDRSERQKAAVAKLMENLQIEEMDESRLIRIAYLSEDPVLAARIINGFGEAFIATSLERRYQASAFARNFLEEQIVKVRDELENSERQLVRFAQQQGIISASDENEAPDAGSLQRATLVALNEELAAAQARRIAAEERYRQAQNDRLTAEQQERTDQLRNQQAVLEAEYREKLNLFRPDYPEMVQLRSRIDSIGEAIGAIAGTVRAGRRGTLQAEYQAALAEESALSGRVNQLKGEVLNLRGRSVQYNIVQREVDTNRSLYDALLQRYKEVGVAGGIGNSHVSIVDRGDVPAMPFKPNLILNLLIGVALGLASGFGLAMALEFISDTIKSPEDVREKLGLTFLGGVPGVKGRQPVQDLEDPSSPLSEAYLSAATSLQFASDEGVPHVLLLSSTRPAEGKSTTTWALANQFASLGRSVLLIDADMRKPTFVTGAEKEDGLSTLLTTRTPLSEHIVRTDLDRLWLLPCGPLPPNPAELLSSNRLREVLSEARGQFDLVLVDGPPVLGLADSPLLSRACDATLLVIEASKTRTTAAVEALNRLRQTGSNLIGAILTRYREDAGGYGYNYEAYSYRTSESKMRQIRALAPRTE